MDLQEFKSQVLPIKDKLFRIAMFLLKSREEAEDAVQEIFLRLWNKREKLDEYHSVEALAVTSIKNYCLDKLKSKKHRYQQSDSIMEIETGLLTPYKSLEASESASLVLQIFHTLPDQQKLIIQLRDVEEYSYEEIEQVTGMNINAIRVSLARARKTVRDYYLKINDYESSENR
jgi:RNA polymerase sigma factor (sigma-70 family)